MCDPISLAVTAVAAGSVYQASQARKSAKEAASIQAAAQTDPAAERAKAEAEAAQRANAALADANRRRRDQQSLLAKGAPTPQFSFGDQTTGPSNVLDSNGLTTRGTTSRQASLMSRGAAVVAAANGGSSFTGLGGGGSRNYKFQNEL